MKNLQGVNWLSLSVENQVIQAKKGEESLFTIPLSQVANSSVINKNDVQIEFPYNETRKEDDNLCEVRFYFPPQQKTQGTEGNEKEEESQEEMVKNEAEVFQNLITSSIGDSERVGESIVTFEEIPLLVPRGKYTFYFCESFLRFHGQTHNYKIEYRNVERAFLLPKPDNVYMILVYPYIIVQLKKDIEKTFKLNIKEEQKSKFNENLQEEYTGPVFDVLTKMCKLIIQTNIIIPGSFKSYCFNSSHHNQSGIRCSVKAQEGILFPLTKSLIFVHKPVLYLRMDDIALAIFQRIGTGSKLFDVELKRKSGGSSVIFTSIDKSEMNGLKSYLESKHVKIEMEDDQKQIQQQLDEIGSDIDVSDDSRSQGRGKKGMDFDEDSDDESFVGEEDSDEDSDEGESAIDDEDL